MRKSCAQSLRKLNIEDLKFLRLQILTQFRKNNLIVGYIYNKYKCIFSMSLQNKEIIDKIKQIE